MEKRFSFSSSFSHLTYCVTSQSHWLFLGSSLWKNHGVCHCPCPTHSDPPKVLLYPLPLDIDRHRDTDYIIICLPCVSLKRSANSTHRGERVHVYVSQSRTWPPRQKNKTYKNEPLFLLVLPVLKGHPESRLSLLTHRAAAAFVLASFTFSHQLAALEL